MMCPGGCCEGHFDWVCCNNGRTCAVSPTDCSAESAKTEVDAPANVPQLLDLVKAMACDDMMCPGGCCEGHFDWVCCNNGRTCAATPADCSAESVKVESRAHPNLQFCDPNTCTPPCHCDQVGIQQFCNCDADQKLEASAVPQFLDLVKTSACDGMICPGGCCEGHFDWVCCNNGRTCAVSPADCSAESAKGEVEAPAVRVLDVVKPFAGECDGTECCGGCCEGHYGWFCCPDCVHCAATPADCRAKSAARTSQRLLRRKSKRQLSRTFSFAT